jgi:hypothetical protein
MLERGWMVLVVMVALAAVTAWGTYVRNTDTARLNGENRRLNDCVRDLITTVSERSAYTSKLDGADAADRAATQRFWTGVAGTTDPAKRRAVFDEYQRQSAAVEASRKAILADRNAHKFPSLAQCQ